MKKIKKPKGMTRQKAINLGQQFVDELSKELDIPFIYWFDGSLARGDYKQDKSDIDMVILPNKSCDYTPIAFRLISKMKEYGQTYGHVFKHGRWVSIIDPMIFLSSDMLMKFHSFYNEILQTALDENKCLKRIKLDKKQIEEWEHKWELTAKNEI